MVHVLDIDLSYSNAVSLKSTECALCKYVVSYLDTVLQSNKSEAAIEAALEKVCNILPASLKPQCTTFVDTYGPILAQLLTKYITPDQVCDALKLCKNNNNAMSFSGALMTQ
jgi:saposin